MVVDAGRALITVVMLGYDWWLCMVINIVYSIAVGFSPLYC